MLRKVRHIFFESPEHYQYALICLLGLAFYLPVIGSVRLFDWDEINFAEITREMLITGDFFKSQIDFQPFYEKPPMFNWIQILSFSIFGRSDFAARFPNALFGIFTLLLVFHIGKTYRDKRFGMLWSLLYLGSFLPSFYFKSGVIDPIFNFFIFASIYLLSLGFRAEQRKTRRRYFLLAGLLNGLSVITKGPVGLLIAGLAIVTHQLLYDRRLLWQKVKDFSLFLLAVFLVTLVWILPQYARGGLGFLTAFTTYMLELLIQDVATHGQPFYYHFVVIFLGCFPISVFGLSNVCNFQKDKTTPDFNRWMFCLFWVVLLLFSMVKTKIVHYSSMTYLPLAYLAADYLTKFRNRQVSALGLRKLYLIMGGLYAILFAAAPCVIAEKSLLLRLFAKDVFAQETIKGLEIPLWSSVVPLALLGVGVVSAFFLFKKGKIEEAVLSYSLLLALFLNVELAIVLPPVERAVQGGAMDFYSRFAGKDVYLSTFGFKSYGRIYYFEKSPQQAKYNTEQLLNMDVDKPVYFVSKIDNQELNGRRDFRLIEKKGGFALFLKSSKFLPAHDSLP